MDFFTQLFSSMDTVLMPVYRMHDTPLFGYYLGTFVLSFLCVITGEYSMSLAYHTTKDTIDRDTFEMAHFQNMSIKALKARNKDAYRACNRIASDAYGSNFFSRIALSASSLWPVFLGLGWMQYRFGAVDFSALVPVSGAEYILGYGTTFVLCYIASRILFHSAKNKYLILLPRKELS
jgi:hypothetical protein